MTIIIDSQKDIISRKIKKKNFIQTNLTQTALAAKRGWCRPDKQHSFKYQHEKDILRDITILGKYLSRK